MWVMAIGGGAFLATLAGGLFALRLKDKLHLILGFSAGAVLGVAFFDLLPEALALADDRGAPAVLSWTAVGFLVYLIADRVLARRSHGPSAHGSGGHGHDGDRHDHGHGGSNGHHADGDTLVRRDLLGAGSLSAHSLMDGIAVGLAFQTSHAIGVLVAIAVLAHDFSDGVNTMNVVLKNGGSRGRALRWLLADAVAPGVGIASTFFFSLPPDTLGVSLAAFAGFFLYIGASDLIPESYHSHPKFLTTLMTLLGAAMLFLVTRLVQTG